MACCYLCKYAPHNTKVVPRAFPWTQFALPAVAFAIVIAALTSCELPEAVYAQDLNIHRLRIIEFERRACKLVHQGCNFLHAACGTRQSIKGLKAA